MAKGIDEKYGGDKGVVLPINVIDARAVKNLIRKKCRSSNDHLLHGSRIVHVFIFEFPSLWKYSSIPTWMQRKNCIHRVRQPSRSSRPS
ncbi:hypothetical protein L3Y34_016991 [Caenorhabditis briggsae]|uniref:Uncharacterized protein n=1 Tax=Caenorhabditis briggsae TaxID=6238 RepID=A0AAE9DHB6_CAEBR|nr:hypothetical protein L3Y34_016991 [Caenorhabditis briggsae]